MSLILGVLSWGLAVLLLLAVASVTRRQLDRRREEGTWRSLSGRAGQEADAFAPAMVEGLPEAARRFFLYTIEEGARLRTVAEVVMDGEIGLGDGSDPRYLPMRGHQIIAPPFGLVWKLEAGSGFMRISGSDGFDGSSSWVRFWLMNLIPVVRAGGGRDHARSAFGRVVAESVFFAPAALLPREGVSWEPVSDGTARATVRFGDMTQTVDVSVDEDGRPHTVVIPRWSDANPENEYRVQPFGGTVSEFQRFDGYLLPTRIEGGNFIGTPDYFPFYRARVESIRFLPRG